MKITIIQTVIVIEDDEQCQHEYKQPVDPFLDFLETIRVHLKPEQKVKRIQEARHGSHVPQ
jgi:hypothetical protein